MKIAVVGTGYVGLVSAGCFAAELSTDYAGDPYEACQGADALLVLTEWQSFSELDLTRVAKLLRWPILIHSCDLFDAAVVEASGLDYHNLGRKPREGSSTRLLKQDDSVAAVWPPRRRETEVGIWQP